MFDERGAKLNPAARMNCGWRAELVERELVRRGRGWTYASLGPLFTIHGMIFGKKTRLLAEKLGLGK